MSSHVVRGTEVGLMNGCVAQFFSTINELVSVNFTSLEAHFLHSWHQTGATFLFHTVKKKRDQHILHVWFLAGLQEHPLSKCCASASARSQLSSPQPSTFERITVKSAKHQKCQQLLGRGFVGLMIQFRRFQGVGSIVVSAAAQQKQSHMRFHTTKTHLTGCQEDISIIAEER